MSAKLEAIEARIAAKLEQVRQLKEQKARAERRARAEIKKQEHAKDTRRKILLGALWLEKLKNGTASVETAKAELDPFLTRNADRELFRLPRSSKTDRKRRFRPNSNPTPYL